MNIFYLVHDPKECASYHCDKHIVKMVTEYAQLLSSAHHVLDSDNAVKDIYKLTHRNHPCSVWVRESDSNYKWLYSLFESCCKEYTKRYNRIHLTERKMLDKLCEVPKNMTCDEFTIPPQVVPEQYKNDDCVTAYRNFYIYEKNRFAKWKDGNIPKWFVNE